MIVAKETLGHCANACNERTDGSEITDQCSALTQPRKSFWTRDRISGVIIE